MTFDELKVAIIIALSQAPFPYDTVIPDFEILFPDSVAYAEARIYRDIVPLCQRSSSSVAMTLAGSREVDLSATNVIVVEGLSLVDPAGAPSAGMRYPYDMVSLDMIDVVWPTESSTMSPSAADYIGRWCVMKSNTVAVFAPTPDATYTVEVTGLFPQAGLSSTNQNTYLATTYPDLMQAACMVYLSGYLQKNYAATAGMPEQAVTFEKQYADLMATAREQEQRVRSQGPGWTAYTATPNSGGQRS